MATIKYKDKNGEWKELTVLKGDSGVAPIINPDTNTWLVWDNEQGVYVDTGVVAGVGTEDFYASTYWVFNEMASGKKVIAKALTDRRYPTSNDESFVDMAEKITNMSYEEGWFAKIGYTDENDGGIKEAIDYSYELAKAWNPDGSTPQLFRGNKAIVFAPFVDTSRYTAFDNAFGDCSNLILIPNYDFKNIRTFSNSFYGCNLIDANLTFDLPSATSLVNTFQYTQIKKLVLKNTQKVTGWSRTIYGCVRLEYFSADLSSCTILDWLNCAKVKFMLLTNIGKSTLKTYNFSFTSYWGTDSEEDRQSLIDSLITYSYDRASNGMATATIQLHANTKALLTEEEIAQITAKGFTIA